jgi:hypothetical protein
MPADDGLRSREDQRRLPGRSRTREGDPARSVATSDPRPLDRSTEHRELPAKCRVLEGQFRPAACKDANEDDDQPTKHHPVILPEASGPVWEGRGRRNILAARRGLRAGGVLGRER